LREVWRNRRRFRASLQRPAGDRGAGDLFDELIEQVPGLDAVVAPIGGGGMISGTCLALSHLAPGVKIYAAEPSQRRRCRAQFPAGHIIADDAPETVADGLKVPLKDLTWHFVKAHVSRYLDRRPRTRSSRR
jgi:threonine dehydratase